MQRTRIVTTLTARLGAREDLSDVIVDEMDFVQETALEGNDRLPWFLEKWDATLVLTAGADELTFPVDFIQEYPEEDIVFWMLNSDATWEPMIKGDFDQQSRYTDNTNAYSITSTGFKFPLPYEENKTFRLRYMAKDVLCSVSNENLWMQHAPDVLIGEVGQIMARYIQNQQLEMLFMQDATLGWDRVWARHAQRLEAGRTRQMKDI